MPVFNTPINTDDNNLAKVLNQTLPIALYIYDNRLGTNKSLDEAITKAAKEYAGQLLVVRVDASANPKVQADYGNLATPALITLSKDGTSRTVKSKAANVTPSDVQAHIAYLLGKGPAPKQAAPAPSKTSASSTASTNGSSTKPQVVTDATFDSEVLKSKVPVLVDFWAPWCGPCRTIAPVVEQMAQKYAGRAKVVKVNVDDNPRIARQFQVMSIPTLITFKNGSALKRQVGANPTIIPSMIEEALR